MISEASCARIASGAFQQSYGGSVPWLFGEAPSPCCFLNRPDSFPMASRLHWTSKTTLYSLQVKNGFVALQLSYARPGRRPCRPSQTSVSPDVTTNHRDGDSHCCSLVVLERSTMRISCQDKKLLVDLQERRKHRTTLSSVPRVSVIRRHPGESRFVSDIRISMRSEKICHMRYWIILFNLGQL